jgi:hypothetical protein
MRLGEQVSRLIKSSDREEANSATNKVFASKVTINLYVFGALMEDIIVSYLNCTLFITMKISGRRLGSIHISQEPMKPKNLSSGICKRMIFRLSS